MYKLLLADDEPIERDTMKIMIAKNFPEIIVVGEAATGREAIIKARELGPDLIFMDIKMPGITGVEAAKTIKRENQAIKIVIVTAYDYFEYAKESLKAGIDDFLLKPALIEDIRETLEKLTWQIKCERKQKEWPDSFVEAKIALGYTDSTENSHYGDINLAICYDEYPYHVEKHFCEEIVGGNLEKTLELQEKLIKWIISNRGSIKELQRRFFELITMITRAAAVFKNIDNSLLDTSRYFEELKEIRSVTEFEAYLDHLVRIFINQINSARQLNISSQIVKVTEFIATNYASEITLEEVARVVSLSPSYFSKIFKTETGENFIDYLTKYRMKIAENLLKDKNLSIKDICYQVGYNDPNYFSKLFKKHFGKNPTEYKAEK